VRMGGAGLEPATYGV